MRFRIRKTSVSAGLALTLVALAPAPALAVAASSSSATATDDIGLVEATTTGTPEAAPQAITLSAATTYTSDMAAASVPLDAAGIPIVPRGTRSVAPPKCFVSYGWVTPSRTLACGVFRKNINYINRRTLAVVGTSTSTLWITKTTGNGGKVTEDYSVKVNSATGVALSATSTYRATGTGANRGINIFSVPMTPGTLSEGKATYTAVVAAGLVADGKTSWSQELTNTLPNVTPGTFQFASQTARCDNAVSGNINTGCVNADVRPALQYSKSDPAVNETATHIAKAQGSDLPSLLHRETNAATITKNRTFSCSGVPSPRPTGKDCDEYPFASTKEGGNSTGGTRTFADCGITQTVNSTGPGGVSRCLIDSTDNQTAGRQLAAMYLKNRVLDGDEFTVKIVA